MEQKAYLIPYHISGQVVVVADSKEKAIECFFNTDFVTDEDLIDGIPKVHHIDGQMFDEDAISVNEYCVEEIEEE